MNDPILVQSGELDAFCRALLEGAGLPAADAADTAAVLVRASLRGVDTHGVVLMDYCLRRLEAGGANAKPRFEVLSDGPCTACWDADRALGQVSGMRAMRMAIEKAAATGIGCVAVRNSSHTGPMGPYVLAAAEKGFIGIGLTNTVPAVALYGAASRSIGNNVVAIACPGEKRPWVFDACLGCLSWGKLREARAAGRTIPEGCVVDANGGPVLDPARALDEGIVLPIGGHKGSGLALFVDILTAVLAGGPFSGMIEWSKTGFSRPHLYSHTFAALDISRFRPLDEFRRRLGEIELFARSQPPMQGGEGPRMPGERQAAEEERRLRDGIPLDARTVEILNGWAKKLGVRPLPRQ